MSTPPFKVKAVFEYTSPEEEDLHFSNGQIITVTENDEEDWYTGEYVDASGEKQEGIFPRNFVEKYEPTAPPRPNRIPKARKEEAPPPAEIPEPADHTIVAQLPATESIAEPAPIPEISAPVPKPQPMARAVEAPQPAPAATKAPTPAGKPIFSPSEVPEKPSGGSFRDRIAAFNKPAAAPVAPFKPSGLGSSGGSSFIKKPFVAPPPSKNSYVAPPRDIVPQAKVYRRDEDPEIAAHEAENQELAAKAGLSPASNEGEEEDQPKPTSLKERIALLQKQQMEQAARHAEAAQKKEKPKRPVKKRTDSQDPAQDEAEGSALEKQDSQNTVGRQSLDSAREEPAGRAPMPRRKSSKGPPAIPGFSQESYGDGNEADMSGAGDETEGHDEASTERDDFDEAPRAKAPVSQPRAPAAPIQEPDVGEEDGAEEEQEELEPEEDDQEEKREGEEGDIEEGEEEEDEEDIDPEVRRKEELRARMAKMSGGMGMHGMFGPPGGMGMGMPGPSVPVKKKASGSSQSKQPQVSEAAETPIARAPPVPMPGMSRVKTSENLDEREVEREEERRPVPITSTRPSHEVADVEDIRPEPPARAPMGHGSSEDNFAAPPVPGARPAPPPVPTETRPQPSQSQIPMSPSAGSESDDESSMIAPNVSAKALTTELPTRSLPPRPLAPTVPSRPSEGPGSPRSPTNKRASFFNANEAPPASPISPVTNRRASRVPPIPGPAAPPAPSVQTRAPPPPPPTGTLSRSSTGDAQVLPPSQHIEPEESEEEITEYEGDYDTDIAPTASHKEALKATERESTFENSGSVRSPVTSPVGAPRPLPPTAAPRAVPPPLPTLPPAGSRQSIDTPRGAPPPPPPPKEPAQYDDEEYDPFNYSSSKASVPTPTLSRRRTEEDIYGTSPPRAQPPRPQDRAAPPAPPRDLGPPPARGPPKQSMDVQRVQSSARRSTDMSRMSMDTGYVATDVDLSQGTLWWAQPKGLPPVFQNRSDILHETEESTSTKRGGQSIVSKDLYVLFQDYSQTVITVSFDGSNPADVKLEQRHEQPPSRLRQDQLEEYYERFGRKIGEAATSKKETTVGDGTSQGLINFLLAPFKDALLPVGTRAYGALVYSNMANATITQNDEIRPGDIVTLRNARFQGKHGPMHAKYSIEVGTGNGHVAIVNEWDGTKKKVRAWEQGKEQREGKKDKVKLESYKLDDLRSGEVKIWRVMPRSWVGWEGSN